MVATAPRVEILAQGWVWVLPSTRPRIVIPRPDSNTAVVSGIELLPGEPVRHAGIVGDLVDPGLAEREVFEVLIDLAGGVGDEARAAQVIGVIEVLVDRGEVLGPGAVAFAGRELLELGRNPRGAGEDLLRVPAERRHVPRVDVKRLAARALLDDAVGAVVIFEGGRLARVVGHRLQPIILVPDHAPVLRATGVVPAGLVAVEVVEVSQGADLAGRVRPAAGIGVRVVVGERQVRRLGPAGPQIERGLRLAGDVVDAVVGHREAELLRGHVGLGEGAGGRGQLVEVVVAEAIGGGPAIERGARRDRRRVAKRQDVAHRVVAIGHGHEGPRGLGLGGELRHPPVERVVGVAGGRAVAQGHLLAGLELVVADEVEVVVGRGLLLARDGLDVAAAIVVEGDQLAIGVGQGLDAVPGVVAIERGEHRVGAGHRGLGGGADFLCDLAQGAIGARQRAALGGKQDEARTYASSSRIFAPKGRFRVFFRWQAAGGALAVSI